MISFTTAYRQQKVIFEGTLLAIDPGETTGYWVFTTKGPKIWDVDPPVPFVDDVGELDTSTMEKASEQMLYLFNRFNPTHVVYEDYRVYGSKAQEHTNNELLTTKVIGIIEHLCAQNKIPVAKQMASLAKGFVTDDKLKAWRFYERGLRHCRDACRHAIYYLLFRHNKLTKERQDEKAKPK